MVSVGSNGKQVVIWFRIWHGDFPLVVGWWLVVGVPAAGATVRA